MRLDADVLWMDTTTTFDSCPNPSVHTETGFGSVGYGLSIDRSP